MPGPVAAEDSVSRPCCDLCGLPVRGDGVTDGGDAVLRFCCVGCRMVYRMLADAADSPEPSRFKETELYRRCVAAGVIPADENDLNERFSGRNRTDTVESPPPNTGETLPLQIKIDGMWCPACAWVIQSALEQREGITDAACDFATDRLRCRYDPVRSGPDAIIDVIKKLGYRPFSATPEEQGDNGMWTREFVRLVITALLSANVMMLSWALYSGFFTSLSHSDIRFISWPILVMATIVMIYGGGPLFQKAFWGVRHGAPGMEALVCLGVFSAYVYSVFNFAVGSWHLYFDTAAMLITLVLLGKLLETKAKTNVRRDLEGFLALQPNKARIVTSAFPRGRFAALEQLAPGDRFRVEAREMVPADGRVVSGEGTVDASAVTGESRPIAVSVGDAITSGTVLTHGQVVVETLRVGAEALLGQMIVIIERGLTRRTPLKSRTDRWLALFVPLMAGVSAATGAVGWLWGLSAEQAFVRALTVLVIACPCALGIAIPLARIAGISRASRMGILVRDMEAFERAAKMDDVVFDKTGTLTHGRWRLEKIKTRGQVTEDQAVALAAGLEKDVDHAIARLMVSHASERGLVPAEVTDIHVDENGVRGIYQGCLLRIGTPEYASDNTAPEVSHTGPTPPHSSGAHGAGGEAGNLLSTIFLSRDREPAAAFSFGDALHRGTTALVRRLMETGHDVHLVSGDAHGVTRAAARIAGVRHALGDLLPQDKAEVVERLQKQDRRVVMVGDGVNDAPALAGADLSVAVHRDATLSRQAADVTLMRGDPLQLLDFLSLAGQVNAKVAQNLTCAWIYNLVGVPIAMSGLLNPLVSATAMLLSSLTVIGNTLLLVRKR